MSNMGSPSEILIVYHPSPKLLIETSVESCVYCEFNVRRVWDEGFEYYYDRTGALRSSVFSFLDSI